jgi:predicted metal-dependent hydrolase
VLDRSVLRTAAEQFNRKQYFECHDTLEDAWAGERGEDREFLRALIHVSVGMYHVAARNYPGAVNLLASGVEGLSRFTPTRHGLDVSALVEKANRCLAKSRLALGGEEPDWDFDDVPRMELSG